MLFSSSKCPHQPQHLLSDYQMFFHQGTATGLSRPLTSVWCQCCVSVKINECSYTSSISYSTQELVHSLQNTTEQVISPLILQSCLYMMMPGTIFVWHSKPGKTQQNKTLVPSLNFKTTQ